jgi:4-hydroxysphinganine ceramide fatty acyl 2-hydroxylase
MSYLSVVTADSVAKTLACFFLGNFIWTILEYTLHRFLFHIDEWLPDKPIFLVLHFMMHGIHHYLPMDRYIKFLINLRCRSLTSMLSIARLRLVMPPTLFFLLQLPFTQLAYVIFPVAIANGIIAGAFTFCKNSPSINSGYQR